MKKPDLESTLVAGLAGTVLLTLFSRLWFDCAQAECTPAGGSLMIPATGFAVGAGVQIGVRALGVS
jgi:hypothetical protein